MGDFLFIRCIGGGNVGDEKYDLLMIMIRIGIIATEERYGWPFKMVNFLIALQGKYAIIYP